ncbi:hypothetical protein [Oribacterium sp. C9]|uniref:hypothetical protein n=1 Tax=Oribacterium sp. C9 TaxID=1943579 RepID=UPI00143ACC1D|nr:hypothetical protein [Oribacterium sp. C9]
MNIISNRTLHQKIFEKDQKSRNGTVSCKRPVFDTAIIINFDDHTRKKLFYVKVEAL